MRTFLSAMGRLLTAMAFGVVASAGAINMKWDDSVGGERAFYRVYIGEQPGVYRVAKETPWNQLRISGLKGGRPYYVTVRAVDPLGVESENSPETRFDMPLEKVAVTVSASSEEKMPWGDFVGPATLSVKAVVGVPVEEVAKVWVYLGYKKWDGSSPGSYYELKGPSFALDLPGISGASEFFIHAQMILKTGQTIQAPINDGDGLPIRIWPRVPRHLPRIISPDGPVVVSTPVTFDLLVDDVGTPTSVVVWRRGSEVLGMDWTPPYSIQWTNTAPGYSEVYAEVHYRNIEPHFFVTSSSVAVQHTLPQATSVLKVEGISAGKVSLRGLLSNCDGLSVSKVQFLEGTTVIAEDMDSPYEATWQTTPGKVCELTCRVVFNSGHVLASSPISATIPDRNQAPLIALEVASPTEPRVAPATMEMEAVVDANGNSIQKVQFLEGEMVLGEDSTAPYVLNWTVVSARKSLVTARLFYEDGMTIDSAPVAMVVANPKPTASLTITVPDGGWIAPATVVMEAVVNANGNGIQKVQFLEGGQILGEAVTAPYGFSWVGVSARSTTVTARVIYREGKTIDSAPVTVVVKPAPPPSVVLEVLDDGSDFRAPAQVILRAQIEPRGQSIQKISFLSDGVPIREVKAPPFEVEWENVSAGTKSIMARVFYGVGLVVDSAPLDLTIVAALPSPWRTRDVGVAGIRGSAQTTGGRPLSFILSGGGTLRSGMHSDSFRFVFQPLTGNGEIEAEVSGENLDSGTEVVGLMIRENLNDSSSFAFVGVGSTPFLYRSQTGAPSLSIPTLPLKARRIGIKRMVKAGGDTILLRYFDESPATGKPRWVNFRSVPGGVVLPKTVYVGLVVASSELGIPTTAWIKDPLVYQ